MNERKTRGWRLGTGIVSGLVAGLVLGAVPSVSLAQEEDVRSAGRVVYEENCGSCHGPKADGQGVVAQWLNIKPADLSGISQRNDGEFPFWRIYRTIDGREEVKSHGDSEMPVWGREFRIQAGGGLGTGSPAIEAAVRGKILSLVLYLQSIQKEGSKEATGS